MNARDRLIVALDVPTADAARGPGGPAAGAVGMFKVGSQLFTAAGPDFVRELVARGEKVFLDLKFHDIPNTVAGAVGERAAPRGLARGRARPRRQGHARGGRRRPARDGRAPPGHHHPDQPRRETLGEIGVSGVVAESVRSLARLARRRGRTASWLRPTRWRSIREACGPDFLIVTPGIRPAGASCGDQARAATPAAALAAGADYLVVGRPITEAADPPRPPPPSCARWRRRGR